MTERYTTTIESPWEIHPDKYQVMSRLGYDKYRALKNLIEESGIEVPIMVDGDMFILDGHHRRMAWMDLLNAGSGIPGPITVDVRADLTTEDQKWEVVYSLNAVRREHNEDERKKLLNKVLKAHTHWANGRIANDLGTDDHTVARMRNQLEQLGVIAEERILQARNGRWQGSVELPDGSRQKFMGSSRKEVQDKIDEAQLEVQTDGIGQEQSVTNLPATSKPLKPIGEEVRDALRANPRLSDRMISRATGGALWLVEVERQRLEDAEEIVKVRPEDPRPLGRVSLGEIEAVTGIQFRPPETPVEEVAFNKVGDLVALIREKDLSGEDVAHHVSDDPTFAYGLGQDYDFLIEWIREFVVELLRIGENSEIQQLQSKVKGN